MLRVDGCVFCSISLLSVYMCVRIPLSSRSVAGESSSRALPGPGFLSNHLSAFLIDGCVATKQPKNGNLCDIEEKSNLIKLKVCDKDFRKQMISSESPHPLPGPFSGIQCDFRSQNAPDSWVTVRDRDLPRDCVAEWRLMSTKPNQRSRVQIHLLRKI